MPFRFLRLAPVLCLIFFLTSLSFAQKTPGSLQGQVADPSGAIIPGASITLSGNGKTLSTTSGETGGYEFNNIPAGQYTINTTIEGFTPFQLQGVGIPAGKTLTMNIQMILAVQQQEVQVHAEGNTIDTTPESNANSLVVKGKDLDALSDDPSELASEIQALAGPAAGPNGSQIYIDGFSGGEIPPKSSIREIKVNTNPFSAEYDRLGYGRIEIFTKPGTDKIRGHIFSRGNYSGFNAQNPILNANLSPGQPLIKEPSYYSYFINGDIGGPITPGSSYFVNAFNRNTQNVEVVNAINPTTISAARPNGLTLNEAISNPMSRTDINPRIDLQLGKSNTLTLRYSFYRVVQTNDGIGQLSLPDQGYNLHNEENQIQASDSLVLSKNFVDNIRFQYRHIRDTHAAQFTTPQVAVQGAFINGGSNLGTVKDAQDDFELQDYFTGQKGRHALNFGTRLRAYDDANYSNAGTNGSYIFQSMASYRARTPQQYQVTVVNNNQYTARAVLFDAALFYQDDWTISRKFTFSYGVRWETQNYIHDKNDWAPRVYLAYALGHSPHPKTVVRAGYGWFYERFTVPNGSYGVPYILQTIHNNLPSKPGVPSNQQIYTVTNPTGYTPTTPGNAIKPGNPTTSSSAPTYWTLAPSFHSAVDMQGAIGIDRQVAKNVTGNITYLYSRGVHQYLSNNVTAPYFNGAANIYPTAPLAPPSVNIYQFQSGAVYRQDQIIATLKASLRQLSIFSFYTYNIAKGDTNSVFHFASNASDPGQDYGRTSFDVHNRFLLLASYNAPYAFTFSPMLVYNSGIPYNVRIGSDLTGNNQFNARPTFANPAAGCAAPLVRFGQYCLNPNPVGTKQPIVPYGLGTGPSNYSINMRVSKVIGFGPRVKFGGHGGFGGFHGHGLGGRGLSGNAGGPGHLDAMTPHKYSVTLSAFAENLLNHENLGVPNGTLNSPAFFGKSQSLARGFFNSHTAGNRSIFVQTAINF